MESVREFFVRVNRDSAFRAQFINSPAKTLESCGITLSEDAKRELISMVPTIKKHLPNLANIPAGYNPLLDEVGKEGNQGVADDPDMLIL